ETLREGGGETTVCRILSCHDCSLTRLLGTRLRAAGAKAETPGSKYAGGHRSRVPPVPIPNTEVKPATADGTARETVWESRSLPALFVKLASWKTARELFVVLCLVLGASSSCRVLRRAPCTKHQAPSTFFI